MTEDFRPVIQNHPFLSFLHRQTFRLYWVGGGVRDWLLFHRYPTDWDFATPDDPIRIAHHLEREGWGQILQTTPLGTVTLQGDIGRVDLARFRKERYPSPGALPEVSFTSNIEEDLHRRDFTVNAMAVNLSGKNWGELIDCFQGISDLKRRLLRPIHPHSFRDDPTRMFRGIRYTVRLKFRPSSSFYRQIRLYRDVLYQVSFARIRNEWMRIAVEKHRAGMVRRIARWGLGVPPTSLPSRGLRCVDRLIDYHEDAWIWFFLLIWWHVGQFPPLPEHLTRKERRLLRELTHLQRPLRPSSFARLLLRYPTETWPLWGCIVGWPRPSSLNQFIPPSGKVLIQQEVDPHSISRIREEWLVQQLNRRWPF